MSNPAPLAQVQARLEHMLQRYQSVSPDRLTVKAELDALTEAIEALDEPVIRVAVFGLVSRGKSAVINALLGKKLLKTGPAHGVTQWPRSVYWSPAEDLRLELVDTPGLGEVAGTERADMARAALEQADLVLFVVAGELTRTESEALVNLWQSGKPVLLVFNKIDQYPDQDRQSIAESLQARAQEFAGDSEVVGEHPLHSEAAEKAAPKLTLRPDDIVLVAADPAPVQVQVEWPDGRITHEWEQSPAQIEPLRQRLLRRPSWQHLTQRQIRPLASSQKRRLLSQHKRHMPWSTCPLHSSRTPASPRCFVRPDAPFRVISLRSIVA